MSSSADANAIAAVASGENSHPPPPADVRQSSISVHDDEKHRSTDHNNENLVEEDLNSVILTKIDPLGFGNGNGKNSGTAVDGGGGATEAKTVRKSVEISPDRMSGGESYRYEEEVYDDLAPDLWSKNGRMRFDLVTVRENGRLRMFMVPNRWPQLVRSPLKDGRLRMWLLDDDDEDQRGGGKRVSPPYDGGQ